MSSTFSQHSPPPDEPRTADDGQTTGSLAEFLAFKWFITPWLVQILYALLSGLMIISALIVWLHGLYVAILGDFDRHLEVGLGEAVAAMFGLVVGLITIRIYCELLILAFKGYERLREISRQRSG